ATSGKKTVSINVAYTLSESTVPGYAVAAGLDWSCNGGTFDSTAKTIMLAAGADVTCQITNDDQQGSLIVKKVVINNNGGSKKATDFSFQVGSGSATAFLKDTDDLHGKNTLTLDAGTYTITEPAVTGYTTTYDNCTNVSLANGGTQTCTITNNDQQGTLIVKKVVINDNGLTKKATDFSFQVNGD